MTKPFYIKCILLLPLLLLLSLISNVAIGQSLTGSVSGKVINEKGEALDYAIVQLLQNDKIVGGIYSDENGNYLISEIAPGEYEVRFSYFGCLKKSITNNKIIASNTTILDITLEKDKGEKKLIRCYFYGDKRLGNPGQDKYNQDQIRTILGGR